MTENLYREHRIFRRTPKGGVVYVCFERLGDGHFVVQQAEFFYDEKTGAERLAETSRIAAQTLELFAEGKVRDARQWFPSIAEAIASHDSEFGN